MDKQSNKKKKVKKPEVVANCDQWNALRSQIVTLEDLKSQIATSKSDHLQSVESLTSQIATLKNGRGQHRKFLPYVFTRNGIGMLSSVLRSETAVEVNIRIMRAFTAIADIVNNNALMIQRILHRNHGVGSNDHF